MPSITLQSQCGDFYLGLFVKYSKEDQSKILKNSSKANHLKMK